MDRKPCYCSIKWDSLAGQLFFLIDTMADNKDRASVNHLRECLSSEESSFKLDVPVMWFICQKIICCTPKRFFMLRDQMLSAGSMSLLVVRMQTASFMPYCSVRAHHLTLLKLH